MSSAASEVFRRWSSHLTTVIQDQDLLVLAWELYALGVVSKPVVDELGVEGLSPMSKKTRLFSAVGGQITVDPIKFEKFLQALRKQPLLKDVADKMVNEMSVTEIHRTSPSLPPGTPMSPPSTASITSPSSLEPDSPYHLPSQSNSGLTTLFNCSDGGMQLAPALVPASSKESSLPSGGGITLGAPLPMPTATGGVTDGLKLGAPLQFNAPMVSNSASELTTTLTSQPPSFSFSSSSSSSSFALKLGTTQAGASLSTTANPLSQIKFGAPTQMTTTTANAPAMPQFSFTAAPPTSTTAQTNLPTFNFSAGAQQPKEANSSTMFAFSATKDLGKSADTTKPSFSISGNSSIVGSLGVLGGAKLEQMPGGFNFGAPPSLGGGEQQKTQPPQQGLALGSSETFVFGGPLVSSQQQTQLPSQNLFAATGDQPPTKPITFNFHSAQATTAEMTQSTNPAPSLLFGSSQPAFGQSGNSGLSALSTPQGLGGNSGGALPKLQFGGNNPSLGGMFSGTQDSKNSTGPLGGMFSGTQDSKNSSGPLGGMFSGTQDSKNSSGPSASSTGFNFSTTEMNLNFGVTAAPPTAASMFSSGSSDSKNVEGRIIRKARRRKA